MIFLRNMRQYQGFYTLACLFFKQNMVSGSQSCECIEDYTPWFAFSLGETRFLSANPSNVSRIAHPGLVSANPTGWPASTETIRQNNSKTNRKRWFLAPPRLLGLRRFPWRPRGHFEIAISLRASSIFLTYPSNVSRILHISLLFP